MTAIIVLSVLVGAVASYPLLRWGRMRTEALGKVDRMCSGALRALLFGTIGLLSILYVLFGVLLVGWTLLESPAYFPVSVGVFAAPVLVGWSIWRLVRGKPVPRNTLSILPSTPPKDPQQRPNLEGIGEKVYGTNHRISKNRERR